MIKFPTARFLAAVLLAVTLTLTACQNAAEAPFLYRDRLSSATVSDGIRTFRITPIAGGFAVEITDPPSVSGILYRITSEASFVSMGEVEIPVSDRMSAAAKQVITLFTPSDDQLLSAKTDKKTGTRTVRFSNDADEITVSLNENGSPLSFKTKDGTWTVQEYIPKPEI